MYDQLKQIVCLANVELERSKMVICNWGNVSGIDRQAGVVVIKPSGVPYSDLTPDKMVVVDLNGGIVDGALKPSSDTPTHLELYRSFKAIGGVCHTHSCCATMWAQACRELPCFGTTHADYFYGAVPLTDHLTDGEIKDDYELNTGKVIVRRLKDIDPLSIPAVLVAGHGPFTWGPTPLASVEAAVVLEEVAKMAAGTIALNSAQSAIKQTLLDKHYLRKHGKNAYYGQR
jgi:L-ribulose-5-phosphate 4-epimerase